ncbi:hypothetical protein [Streptomyces sp. TLI_105]|uniref:hypothetical protein n=1 Tax=Streptomyces sp. TLI_105 TaxID=1881019 RepID=UPI00089B4679|nr:hypothetical protein [Streptomyces sp. TLI_105]SEB63570.1 hypothetical protein SAMN05428939_0273 [Streptomyces sp. TLI_105]
MKIIMLGAVGLGVLAAAGVGGFVYVQQGDDVAHAESLCAATTSDAAEAARAQNLALVSVVERGRFVSKGEGAGLQVFKVRTEAVFKGSLPDEAEIALPEASSEKLQAGSRYEVSVLGPEDGTWLTRFVRAVPASETADAVGAHWKAEIAKKFVETPCDDTSGS